MSLRPIIASLLAMERQMQGNEEAWLAREAMFGATVVKLRDADVRIAKLELALIHEYHELVGGGDYLGEKLMTAQDKIDYMIARVPK